MPDVPDRPALTLAGPQVPLLAARPGIAQDRISAERAPDQIDACAQVLDSLGATSNDIGGRRRSAYPPSISVGGRELRQIVQEPADPLRASTCLRWVTGEMRARRCLGGRLGIRGVTASCGEASRTRQPSARCYGRVTNTNSSRSQGAVHAREALRVSTGISATPLAA